MKDARCKICRRIGEKLFLKGEKCTSPKCPLLRKPYPPGKISKAVKRLSEYGEELRGAQRVKKMYGISERHFKRLVKEVLKKGKAEDVSRLLLERLERKLFNVIYCTGLADSRYQARQLVSHGHFLLNGRRHTISSYEVKVGDEIVPGASFKESSYFENVLLKIKEDRIPPWLSFDKKEVKIKVVNSPQVENLGIKMNIPLVLSFYSR